MSNSFSTRSTLESGEQQGLRNLPLAFAGKRYIAPALLIESAARKSSAL